MLIDADVFMNELNESQQEFDEYYKGLGRAKTLLLSQPAVDAEPVIHAHWNYKCPINGKSYRYCSNCLTIFYDYDKYEIKKFCAGCGAKMEGRY